MLSVTRQIKAQQFLAEAYGCGPCSVRIDEWPNIDGLFPVERDTNQEGKFLCKTFRSSEKFYTDILPF